MEEGGGGGRGRREGEEGGGGGRGRREGEEGGGGGRGGCGREGRGAAITISSIILKYINVHATTTNILEYKVHDLLEVKSLD